MLHVNHAWEPHVNQDSLTECYTLTVHGSHTLIKIPTQNERWHLKLITLKFPHFRQFVKEIFIWMFTFSGRSNKILHINGAWEPHVNPYSFTFHRQFLKENDQNFTWKSLHVSHNIVYNKICHKNIHIWGEYLRQSLKTCMVEGVWLLL